MIENFLNIYESPLEDQVVFFPILQKFVIENIDNQFIDNNPKYIKLNDKNSLSQDIEYFKDTTYKYSIINDIDKRIQEEVKRFAYLYTHVADLSSRYEILTLAAYRVLGHRHIRLPMWNQTIKETYLDIRKNCTVPVKEDKWRRVTLQPLGYNLTVFQSFTATASFYVRPQYSYQKGGINIDVNEGDVVYDCGVGNAVTSLIFALKAGKTGKVFGFDMVFEPRAVANIEMNKSIADSISFIEGALWNKDNEELFFNDMKIGEASILESKNNNRRIMSLTIDSFFKEKNMDKIDFLKMDIEGAELHALFGAIDTLRKFKPKLSICIYHNIGKMGKIDYIRIPYFLKSLNLGYKFYFSHHELGLSESVLYAY